jgi:hypothetical protein
VKVACFSVCRCPWSEMKERRFASSVGGIRAQVMQLGVDWKERGKPNEEVSLQMDLQGVEYFQSEMLRLASLAAVCLQQDD